MVYLSEDPSTCVLEVLVHLDVPHEDLPTDYVLMRVDVPDTLDRASLADLPSAPKAEGDAWLNGSSTPLLSVPSYVVPQSRNLLLNPLHSQAPQVVLREAIDFKFDSRLWKP